MDIIGMISGLFKPAADLVDNLHTSEEEKVLARAQLEAVKNETYAGAIELEKAVLSLKTKQLEAQQAVVVAEAAGKSWLQRNWRPITMIVFLVIILLHYLGIIKTEIAPEMWLVIQIGLGGYVGGRTVEKVAGTVMEGLNNRDTP